MKFPLPPTPGQFPVSTANLNSLTAVSEAPGSNAMFGFKAFHTEPSPDGFPKHP